MVHKDYVVVPLVVIKATRSQQYFIRLLPVSQLFMDCLLVHSFNVTTIHFLVVLHLCEQLREVCRFSVVKDNIVQSIDHVFAYLIQVCNLLEV